MSHSQPLRHWQGHRQMPMLALLLLLLLLLRLLLLLLLLRLRLARRWQQRTQRCRSSGSMTSALRPS